MDRPSYTLSAWIILAQARQVLAAADNLIAEARTGHSRLRTGHAWSAMGRHTREFQRRWAATRTSATSRAI